MPILNLQVAASNRDGDQLASGLFGNITNAVIQIGNNSNPVVACVSFVNVTIPQGDTINSATLVLTGGGTYNAGAATIQATIYGEDVDNSAALTTVNGNMSGRVNTTASTATGSLASIVLNTQYSFDVTAIVQEIVNRGSWASGNAMTFPVRDNGSDGAEWQEFFSWDGDPTKAAMLDVDHGSPVAGGWGPRLGGYRNRRVRA